MATPIWANKPNLSPADVRRIFGSGATLVRAGNGKYTIKNQSQGPGFEGAAGSPAPTPPQAATPAAPAPAPAPPPRSAAIDALIADADRRIGALPGIFDAQRGTLAENTRLGLIDSDLYEDVYVDPVTTDSGTAFNLRFGHEGAAFRRAHEGVTSQHNRRGTLFGTDRFRQHRLEQLRLDREGARVQRDFGQRQQQITQNQTNQLNQLTNQRLGLQGQQEDFGRNAPVAVAPLPQPGEPGGAPLTAPRPSENLIRLGPNRTRQQANTLGNRLFGADQFKVGAPGSGGGLVIRRL